MTDMKNGLSLASLHDQTAQRCRELGKLMREHGERLEKALNDYADRVLADHQELSHHILTNDSKVREEVEKVIGASLPAFKAIEDELRNMTRQ